LKVYDRKNVASSLQYGILIETYKDGVLQDSKNLDHKCYDLGYFKGE